MLCICTGHTREEIRKMTEEGQYVSLADFQNDTFVGTGCGQCLAELEKLILSANS